MPADRARARSSRRSAPSGGWRASCSAEGEFVEIFVDTPLEECRARDPKGLYAKAPRRRDHELHRHRLALRAARGPELHLRTLKTTFDAEVARIIEALQRRGVFD